MASDEVALIELIATGNQDALSQLYALFRPRLWRYLYRLLDCNPDWVEEVMQDVFLAIWMHAHSFRGDSAISTWIFRIGRNKALLAQRSHVRRPEGHLTTIPSELDESHNHWEVTSLEDSVMNRLALAEAFQHLSEIHQEVLELFAYQGFSLDEIAQILVIPSGGILGALRLTLPDGTSSPLSNVVISVGANGEADLEAMYFNTTLPITGTAHLSLYFLPITVLQRTNPNGS